MKNRVVLSILVVGGAIGAASWHASRPSPLPPGSVASIDASSPAAPSSRTTPRRGHTVTVGGEPVDLGDVMSRTRHAFHALDGGELVGGDLSFGVRVADGEIAIHPEAGSASTVGSALRLRTTSVGRRGAVNTAHAYAIREDDGSVEASIAPAITEQLHNTRSGLEQSWTFDDVPDGTGDLVVRISASGEDFAGTTSTGLHFRDSAKGIGLAMSHARWIDADGTTTEIPLRYEHGEIAMLVPANVVENATYPAVLDPTVGPEYDVDTPIVGPAADDQSPVAIGHSGIAPYEFLVAWQDRRRSTDTDLSYDVFGAHVDRSGHVREAVGFMINDPTQGAAGHTDGNQTDPQVEWLPYQNHYIVVWASDVPTPNLSYRLVDVTTNDIGLTQVLTRLNTNDLCHSLWIPSQPSLAVHSNSPNPDHVVVAWREAPAGSNVGMVCAHDYVEDGATGTLADYSGQIFVADDTAGGRDAGQPAVASVAWTLPNRFIIAFQSVHAETGFYQIRYLRYETDHSASYGVASAPAWPTINSWNPSVAPWGGGAAPYDGWVIAYEQNEGTILHPDFNVYGALVSGSGATTSAGFPINRGFKDQRLPSVAGFGLNDHQVFVGWTDWRSFSPSARGTRINLNQRTGSAQVADGPADRGSGANPPDAGSGVSMQGNAGNGVVVHSDELTGYFAVWPDGRNTSYGDVYGADVPFSLAANGTVSNFLISQSANKETGPAVAQCGSKYLVAWTDSRNSGLTGKDIYGSLLNSDGTVAVQNIAITTATGDQQHPVIGCLQAPNQFFVVWEDSRNGNPDLYGTPVDINGAAVPGGGVSIASTASSEAHPAIASGQISSGVNGFAIAYELDNTETNVVMIDKVGTVVGNTVAITSKGAAHGNGTYPDIDFDGTNYVVVWEETPLNGSQHDIWGARLTPTGSLNAPFEIESDPADQRYPRIKFDAGSINATVVFEDDRNLGSAGVDIFAHRITSGASVFGPFAVAESADDEYAPRLSFRAGSGSGDEVTYSRIGRSDGFNFDVMGQSLAAGSTSGSPFAIANATTSREMTPSIACSTGSAGSGSCVVTYRWFSTTDTTNDIDRVKARVLTY